jgi:hypothetical protein
MRCAIYQPADEYSYGLFFVALVNENKWLKLERDWSKPVGSMSRYSDYKFVRLGEMEIDPAVISFDNEEEITYADYICSG